LAGAEIFLADFLREGFLAIRAKNYHVSRTEQARADFLCMIVRIAKM
jgi:hypothetical protein